ncbi:MAG: Na(+) antiporter subunit [Devosia sp.]|nr:Na(+) antiporter subunit [Devosia sp.]
MPFRPDLLLALLPVAPLLLALVAAGMTLVLRRFAGVLLAVLPAAMFAYLATLVERVAGGEIILVHLDWIVSYGIGLDLRLDGLSLVFAMTISGIGAVVLIYAGGYLRGHPDLGRLLALLLGFTGAMLGLVLADNLVLLFVFWEATSVFSFLLIGFDRGRQAARRAAVQALLVTGIGGLALLLGAVLLAAMTGTWRVSDLLAGGSLGGTAGYLPALLLVLLAAFTKSAQVPFHFWLPNAMEAPTPVSAFLHSATMVQAGIYLLARLSPVLGGTEAWTGALVAVGGVTLLWGAVAALRQTDLKLMLAQTTIASLGLLVLMLGLGSDAAVSAAMLYFVGHALYKAALFMVVGAIDHATGTRELGALSGLARRMPLSFLAAAGAALSMLGLPLTLGYFGKEELYLALGGSGLELAALIVAVLGNGVLGGIALAIAIRPFLGPIVQTPKRAHEAGLSLLLGPLVLAAAGIGAAVLIGWFGMMAIAPAASAVAGRAVASHLSLVPDFGSLALWLSLLTWGVAAATFARLDQLRTLLRRVQGAVRFTFDAAFDRAMFGLIRLAGAVTRFIHHGRLELYVVTVFGLLALALFVPMLSYRALPPWPLLPQLRFYEWGIFALAAAGLVALLLARTRLGAIVALGVQGLAVALVYLVFGAPDLAFTQLVVEVLAVVILTLVMTRLALDRRDPREIEDLLRDGTLAVLCGVGLTAALLLVLSHPLDPRLAEFFTAHSVPEAHGRNIVNVIIVDFRGLDTLGEISVVLAAGIAVLALLRRSKPAAMPVLPTTVRKPRRRPPIVLVPALSVPDLKAQAAHPVEAKLRPDGSGA